jgi:hypothetical protein
VFAGLGYLNLLLLSYSMEETLHLQRANIQPASRNGQAMRLIDLVLIIDAVFEGQLKTSPLLLISS